MMYVLYVISHEIFPSLNINHYIRLIKVYLFKLWLCRMFCTLALTQFINLSKKKVIINFKL